MKKKLTDLELFEAGDKTHLREILHPKNDQVTLGYSLAHAFLEPGESSLPHALAERSEAYHFLSGSGTLMVDGAAHQVETGDTVLVPPNAAQYLVNTGREKLSFLCIVSPPWTPGSDALL